MFTEVLKEMNNRGASHCVTGILVNGEEILGATSGILFFNSDKDFLEWSDLQQTIHGDENHVEIVVLQKVQV